jgi:beta-lactam-binding protein with PASTA domain
MAAARRLRLGAATPKLAKAHCRLGSVTRVRSAVSRGLIVSQRPVPRRRLKANTKVSVAVSLGRR